jgi:hypothetical protein
LVCFIHLFCSSILLPLVLPEEGKTLIVSYSRTGLINNVVDHLVQGVQDDDLSITVLQITPDEDFGGVMGYFS